MFQAFSKKILLRLSFALLFCLLAGNFSLAQKADGFYRVEQRNGVWWFVAPDGKLFFSSGVNVVSPGQSRENYNPKNPEYAAFQHYPTTKDWVDETLERLRAWNFNTIGGWSSREIERRGAMPYTKVLHLGDSKLAPWGDLFSPQTAVKINETARREIGNLKNDRNLIGYFSDNELGWWDSTLFFYFLKQPAKNRTRMVLMKLLRAHYANDFARLRRDFDAGDTTNFAALERSSNLTLKADGRGAEVIDKFVFLLAQRYYKLAFEAIRRRDPNHLILGDRYPSWYSQSVARASIPFVDVVSTNYMADWTDGRISHFYLDTLHRLTNKPIIVTEYYMSATENRSGNKNSSAGFPVVRTQSERAVSFRNNLTAFAELPYVVGAHWFQYMDEPTNGRASDGENYNMGLVDINDRPYEELTETAKSLKPDELHAKASNIEKENGFIEIPKATDDADDGLRRWNKKASLVPAEAPTSGKFPFADFYAAWSKDNLYLTVYAIDFVEAQLYSGGSIPEQERMTWTIKLGAGAEEPLRIRFGAGEEPSFEGKNIEYKSWSDSTRSTLLVKIPATSVGKMNWQAGDQVRLQAKLTSHSRAATMQWNQTLKLGERQ